VEWQVENGLGSRLVQSGNPSHPLPSLAKVRASQIYSDPEKWNTPETFFGYVTRLTNTMDRLVEQKLDGDLLICLNQPEDREVILNYLREEGGRSESVTNAKYKNNELIFVHV
jgi:hypothetical protein